MSIRGRPRKKNVERWPGGKVKKPAVEALAPAHWDRIRTWTKDPRLASQIGRLQALGELSVRQVETAFRVQQIYRAFEDPLSLSRHARSPSYEIGIRGSTDNDADTTAAETAYLDLQEHVPYYVRDALERLCVDDCAINPEWFPEVRSLLDYLAVMFGRADNRRKRRATHENGKILYPRPERKFNADRLIEIARDVRHRSNTDDRFSLGLALSRLRPDLDDETKSQVIAFVHAVRARESYRGGRFITSENPSRLSHNRVILSRPTLHLPPVN